jgi:hypothetical protein
MAATKYTFSITNDFPNQKVDIDALTVEIRNSDISIALDYINTSVTECDVWFKDVLSASDSSSILTPLVEAHDGEAIEDVEAPHMDDGRPYVRADTRPLGTQTYFTCRGDSDTEIGEGAELKWDFSDTTSDIYTGSEVPDGFKAKEILLSFHCPIYLKDGSIYFFDAPWGQVMHMDIVVPSGGYYPNPAGAIPASALGLPGTDMYSQASGNVIFVSYVHNHFVYGDCPMGDELNAEGCAVDALPIGWMLRGLIITPESDNISKGYASMEMYRCHTTLLPGQTLGSLH